MAKEPKAQEAKAAAPTVAPAVSGGYQTFDSNEAQRLSQVGGHIVSIVPRYPVTNTDRRMYRAGKRYTFLETKAQLDAMVARYDAQEAA